MATAKNTVAGKHKPPTKAKKRSGTPLSGKISSELGSLERNKTAAKSSKSSLSGKISSEPGSLEQEVVPPEDLKDAKIPEVVVRLDHVLKTYVQPQLAHLQRSGVDTTILLNATAMGTISWLVELLGRSYEGLPEALVVQLVDHVQKLSAGYNARHAAPPATESGTT